MTSVVSMITVIMYFKQSCHLYNFATGTYHCYWGTKNNGAMWEWAMHCTMYVFIQSLLLLYSSNLFTLLLTCSMQGCKTSKQDSGLPWIVESLHWLVSIQSFNYGIHQVNSYLLGLCKLCYKTAYYTSPKLYLQYYTQNNTQHKIKFMPISWLFY